jgi:hypothetical protein
LPESWQEGLNTHCNLTVVVFVASWIPMTTGSVVWHVLLVLLVHTTWAHHLAVWATRCYVEDERTMPIMLWHHITHHALASCVEDDVILVTAPELGCYMSTLMFTIMLCPFEQQPGLLIAGTSAVHWTGLAVIAAAAPATTVGAGAAAAAAAAGACQMRWCCNASNWLPNIT